MQFSLRRIPSTGLNINFSLNLETLNARWKGAAEPIFTFNQQPEVKLSVYGTLYGAQVKGHIDFSITKPCHRCLSEIRLDSRESVALLVRLKNALNEDPKWSCDSEYYNDNEGILSVDTESVDLSDYLVDTVLLAAEHLETNHQNCPGIPVEANSSSFGTSLKSILQAKGIARLKD